jgi:kumamolisin
MPATRPRNAVATTVRKAPKNYQRIRGSERRPAKGAVFVALADPTETLTITIVLRRRTDGIPLPKSDFFAKTPPGERQRLSTDEFAAKYGALRDDLERVAEFCRDHGLIVIDENAAARTIVASGTVAQMDEAFGVRLGRYKIETGTEGNSESYRGRDGAIYVPKGLTRTIVGVFGLDNRSITKTNTADPSDTEGLTVPAVTKLYGFPQNSAAGQTIAIFSKTGYSIADVQQYFGTLPPGYPMPTIHDISVDASNDGSSDQETTQDICTAATAAPGAAIAVYFTSDDQRGWLDLINRVIHPPAGDPVCSVLSCSCYVSDGDDANTLGTSASWLTAVSQALCDAATQHVTVCVGSGDMGTDSKVADRHQHVQYPASDPCVLCVGGTTVGNVNGSSYDEYVWNDDTGATGGGISDHFPLPSYQAGAGVPASLKDGHQGRGVPDVAANASRNSGYTMIAAGSFTAGGTSVAAPMWAGLIAVLNAALGQNLGFVNPALYSIGSRGFRDIMGAPGPADNGTNGVAGYPAGVGWDACTGWGSINGGALLAALKQHFNL